MLLPSRYLIGGAQLIAGAIGVERAVLIPRLAWVYVHPYDRGHGLVDKVWPEIMRRYPRMELIRDPSNTPAGNALMDRLDALAG